MSGQGRPPRFRHKCVHGKCAAIKPLQLSIPPQRLVWKRDADSAATAQHRAGPYLGRHGAVALREAEGWGSR